MRWLNSLIMVVAISTLLQISTDDAQAKSISFILCVFEKDSQNPMDFTIIPYARDGFIDVFLERRTRTNQQDARRLRKFKQMKATFTPAAISYLTPTHHVEISKKDWVLRRRVIKTGKAMEEVPCKLVEGEISYF